MHTPSLSHTHVLSFSLSLSLSLSYTIHMQVRIVEESGMAKLAGMKSEIEKQKGEWESKMAEAKAEINAAASRLQVSVCHIRKSHTQVICRSLIVHVRHI